MLSEIFQLKSLDLYPHQLEEKALLPYAFIFSFIHNWTIQSYDKIDFIWELL